MSFRSRQAAMIAATILSTALFLISAAQAAGKQSFTGEVGDAMCGKKHMEGSADECTRTCVEHGSKYALIVGEKVYILDTNDKNVLGTLDKQAGKNVTVTGTATGDTIEVTSVATAK